MSKPQACPHSGSQIREGPITFSGEMVRAIIEGRKTQTRRILRQQPPQDLILKEHSGRLGYWIPYTKQGLVANHVHGSHKNDCGFLCPYQPGDRRWVRECWRVGDWDEDRGAIGVDYKADLFSRKEWIVLPDEDQFERLWEQSAKDARAAGRPCDDYGAYHWDPGCSPCRWRSSRFMPKVLARIWLEVLETEPQQLQSISCGGYLTASDVQAEGCPFRCNPETLGADEIAWFKGVWDKLHARDGHGWETNPWVWAITFKRLESTVAAKSDD
jgi:hypothetical protein